MRRLGSVGVALAVAALLVTASCTHEQAGSDVDETRRVPIVTVADLAGLEAAPGDADAARALDLLGEIVESRIDEATFTLAFRAPTGEPEPGTITGPDGFVLDSIAECGVVIREEDAAPVNAGCTHIYPPLFRWLEALLNPERYRGMQCGNIATIHSVVKLGLLAEADAFDGDHLNQDQVRALNLFHHARSNPIGMTWEELQDAHRFYATARQGIACGNPVGGRINAATIGASLRTAAALVNSRALTTDCSLEVRGDYGADGEPRISHLEHITSMQQNAAGNWEITTLDGFEQGTTDATIPKAPGSNTWEFGPNMGRFKDGSLKSKAQMGQVVFEHVTISCCFPA